MKQFLLSVVIPSYNEMANLQKGTLEKVVHYLERKKLTYEIIVVDDGSTDGSREFVEDFARENKTVRVIKNSHTGKAGAVTVGVLEAAGDYVLFTDMDQAAPIEELEKFLPLLDEGYDIIIGSRHGRRGAPLTRQIMSQGSVLLRKLLVGIANINDTQCGFKLFSKKAAQDIFSRLKVIHHGFREIKGSSVTSGFDIELLYIGTILDYKIKEVPVRWLYVETRRVNPMKDSIEGVFDLIKIRRNIMQSVYAKKI